MNTEELNYALPDPAWEYSEIWYVLQKTKKDLNSLLDQMAQIESATPESDAELFGKLADVISRIQTAMQYLKEK